MYCIQNMNLAELGEAFRRARIGACLTQQEVATLSGVPRGRISMFETGMLPELGAVKLLSLFDVVGLEILARPRGHQRTLDDVLREAEAAYDTSDTPKRVRSKGAPRGKASGGES